jgi:hypothetical protein
MALITPLENNEKVAVISDVHGNLAALEAVFTAIKAEGLAAFGVWGILWATLQMQ